MPSTTRGEFPYPAGGDNWKQLRLQIQALAQQVATVAALYSHADPRPAAGTPGRLHRNPATGVVSYDSGTAWVGLTVAPLELVAPTSTVKPLAIRGAAGQSASLVEFQNSAGTVLASVGGTGAVKAAIQLIVGPVDMGAVLSSTATAATDRPLIVRGAAAQTANLAEFQTSAGTPVLTIGGRGAVLISAVTVGQYSLDVAGQTPADSVMRVRGSAGQTASLLDIQNSAGTMVASVSAAGGVALTNQGLNRGLEFGAVDSAGTGYRTVRVAN